MSRLFKIPVTVLFLLALGGLGGPVPSVFGEDSVEKAKPTTAVASESVETVASAGKTPRKIADGVMTTIRPFINYSETFHWASIPEILAENPAYEWADDLYFNKEIWCLVFSFKPIRMMEVDFPTESGTMDRKKVWYLVYSVTNSGKFVESAVAQPADNTTSLMVRQAGSSPDQPGIAPESIAVKSNNIDGVYEEKIVDYLDAPADADGKKPGSVRFSPRFVLVTTDLVSQLGYEKDEAGFFRSKAFTRQEKVWNDRFLPLALARIAAQEDPNREFKNSVSIAADEIAPGETVWGIATWTDVDPRTDRFTLYVSGLTNALRWEDGEEAFTKDAPPMTGREIFRKVLKLYFYRPGDEYDEMDDLFHFGIPGLPPFEWVYL